MLDWLKNEWVQLAKKYTEDDAMISSYWQTIEVHYTQKSRHYHNLSHIYTMILLAETSKNDIIDYDALRFAIWYHDIIYKSNKKNNEAKSAEFAKNQLQATSFEPKRIAIVEKLIISTQTHEIILNDNLDNAYLLDMDLAILGTDWEAYQVYIKNIRKEYAIYPDFLYNKGRKKVMRHFLERKRIYFTDYFFKRFEVLARENVEREISEL